MFDYIFSKFQKKNLYSFPRVEVHVTDHCNLNCRGCAHFSNISPTNFLDLNTFDADVSEVLKKIDYKLLNILGGEPLLHPQIAEFFDIARKISPNIILTLSTNGILLPAMDRTFWNSLRRNNVLIRLSVYPETRKNLFTYIELIKSNSLKMLPFWNGTKFCLRKKKVANSDAKILFDSCDVRYCHQLRNGYLYHCPTSAYGCFYNEYYSEQFYKCEGISIYNSSSKEIFDFMNTCIEDCKTCTQSCKLIDWEKSNKIKTEWDAE